MTKEFIIPNIHCMHCLHTIKMELGEIEGVSNVEADLDSKRVKVDFVNPDLEMKIRETLAEINYPAQDSGI